MKTVLSMILAYSLLALPAAAKTESPYAGWQTRDIKALSPQEVDDLRAGRGLSLALAAELNGYPGPRHVLDLGDDLALSDTQRLAVAQLFASMQDDAQRLGAAILRRETALDAAFGQGGIDAAQLQQHLSVLGVLRGELRFVHLRAHLAVKALLSDVQVARYNQLRGYSAEPGSDAPGHGHTPAAH